MHPGAPLFPFGAKIQAKFVFGDLHNDRMSGAIARHGD
jgi:hypothetical protein